MQGHNYVIYGDPAYPVRPLICKPYGGASLSSAQQHFNKSMSTVRQAVEWVFGKVVTEFAFVDFKKKSKAFNAGCTTHVQGHYPACKLPHLSLWQSGEHVFCS